MINISKSSLCNKESKYPALLNYKNLLKYIKYSIKIDIQIAILIVFRLHNSIMKDTIFIFSYFEKIPLSKYFMNLYYNPLLMKKILSLFF